MLCKECKNKEIVRGLKQIECKCCSTKTLVNLTYESGICENCSDTLLVCQRCGRGLKEENENLGFDIVCRDCGSKNCTIQDFGYFDCYNCNQHMFMLNNPK